MWFRPTRKHVEIYIGWANENEDALPDSIIKQFTISVMNMNSNASFQKWLKQEHLFRMRIPVLILLGENEFAFSVLKEERCAKKVIADLDIQIVEGASHLLPVCKLNYINNKVLEFIKK